MCGLRRRQQGTDAAVLAAQLFEHREAVDVDFEAHFHGLHDLVERHAAGGVEDLPGTVAGQQSQLRLFDGHHVEVGPGPAQQLEHRQVGEGLGGVFEPQGHAREGALQGLELADDLLTVVHVEGGAVGFDQVGYGHAADCEGM
jgi:hypothetical protein